MHAGPFRICVMEGSIARESSLSSPRFLTKGNSWKLRLEDEGTFTVFHDYAHWTKKKVEGTKKLGQNKKLELKELKKIKVA